MTRNYRTHLWLAAILLAPLAARAADGTWAVDANGNWSDPSKWSGGIVAEGADFTANFTYLISEPRNVTLDANRSIGNLTFGDVSGITTYWQLYGSGGVLTLDRTDGIPPTINSTSETRIIGTLAGSKGLQKAGPGDLVLWFRPENNTYTGGTTISGGRLWIFGDGNLGDPSGGVTFNGGTLVMTKVESARSISLTALGGTLITQLNNIATLSGPISGSGGLTIQTLYQETSLTMLGITVLDRPNSYAGTTTITDGTLRAVDGIGLPTASNLVLGTTGTTKSATFQSSGLFTRALGTGSGQLRWSPASSTLGHAGFSAYGNTLTVNIGGQATPETLVWGVTPHFLSANSSILILGSTSADSLVDFQNRLDLNGDTVTKTIDVADNISSASDAVQISGSITNGNLSKRGRGTLILTGTNSYGLTSIIAIGSSGGGTLQIGNGGTTGTLGNGAVSLLTTSTLAFNRSDSIEIPNTITSSSSFQSIVQKGVGTTSFSGDMSGFKGSIAVSAGALLINTTVGGTAAVTVNGGTLGGTGSLGTRPVTINAGGTLAPGASIESLDTGSVSFTAAGSRFNPEIDLGSALAADLLNVTGSITLSSSTLDVALLNLPTSQTLPLTFLLVSNDAADPVTGEFGILNSPIGFGVAVNYSFTGVDALGRVGDGNDIAVTITPVPEPAAFALALTAAALLLAKRRWS